MFFRRAAIGAATATTLALTLTTAPAPAGAPPTDPPKTPTATGYGGAVTSVDPDATAIGLAVLKPPTPRSPRPLPSA